jgi:hypothetical protein
MRHRCPGEVALRLVRDVEVGAERRAAPPERSSSRCQHVAISVGGALLGRGGSIPALAQTHHVFAPDLPGSGQSDKSRQDDYSMQFYVDFLRQFLDTLGIDGASLAGISLGGGISLGVHAVLTRACGPPRARRFVRA